jgi:hypothetical protein
VPRVPNSHTEIADLLSSRWQSFPNVQSFTDTTGSYSPFSQTIRLHEIDSTTLVRAFAERDYSLRRSVYPLVAHEYRHFGDQVGTLWGREHLVRLFDAYNIRAIGWKSQFSRVTQVLRDHRNHFLSRYYTEEDDRVTEPWDERPWTYELSCGVHVNRDGSDHEEKPILFTRFSTYDGAFLCRVPFSIASLLEMRAVTNEIAVFVQLAMEFLSEGLRDIEFQFWRRDAVRRLFDATQAVYTVAAHYLSNTIRAVTDLFEAYIIGAEIAGVVLNMPKRFFPQVKTPDRFSIWGLRNDAMKRNCDHGYLYAALIENHKSGGLTGLENFNEWIEGALQASGLPSLDVINKAALEEGLELGKAAIPGPATPRLNDLLEVGVEQFKHHCSPRGVPGLAENPYHPPILTKDGRFVPLSLWEHRGTFATPVQWHREAGRHYLSLEEFVEACVI